MRFYGCNYRESNAHIPFGVYLNCGGDAALETRLASSINMIFLAVFTVFTGIVAIILLILIQSISLALKFIRKRNHLNKRSRR